MENAFVDCAPLAAALPTAGCSPECDVDDVRDCWERELTFNLENDLMNLSSIHLTDQLRGQVGPLACTLAELTRLCRSSRENGERLQALLDALRSLVPNPAAARELLAAHGGLAWSGTFGQSPYEEAVHVMRCAAAGHGLMAGSTANMRALHESLVSCAAPRISNTTVQSPWG